MVRFLSAEWVQELVAALDGSDVRSSVAEVELTLKQVITRGPDGEVSYWTSFSGGTVSGGLGEPPAPADVTITQDYETAVGLSRGEFKPQAAFMQGRLKVTGNMGKLLQHSHVLEALGPVMSSIGTDY